MIKTFSRIIYVFIILSIVYWVALYVYNPEGDTPYDIFGVLLAFLPILGGIVGFRVSREWDGQSSFVGRSILFISASLLMWAAGQSIFLYYMISTRDVPYPGLPDYFFIFIDPLYALSMLSIMRFSGAASSLKNLSWRHATLLLIPLISIYVNYHVFFGDASYFTELNTTTIVDLIYSFGSISIMTLIIITAILSIRKLGGKMRFALYAIFIGILFQYIGDIAYIFAELENTVYNGNLSDFIYFLSIAFVTIGLSRLNTDRLNGGNGVNVDNGVVS